MICQGGIVVHVCEKITSEVYAKYIVAHGNDKTTGQQQTYFRVSPYLIYAAISTSSVIRLREDSAVRHQLQC